MKVLHVVRVANFCVSVSRAAGLVLRGVRWQHPGTVALLAMSIGLAQAAPVTGAADAESPPGIGTLGGPRTSTQISTGNANLDKLLEASATGAAAMTGATSAAKGREPGAASMPGLRDATLRQAMRAEAAIQSEAKSTKQGEGKIAILGLEQATLREDSADADPATRKRWDNGQPADGSAGEKPKGTEAPSAVQEVLREMAQFLRTHRIELFAGLALLGVAAVLVRLYSRAR